MYLASLRILSGLSGRIPEECSTRWDSVALMRERRCIRKLLQSFRLIRKELGEGIWAARGLLHGLKIALGILYTWAHLFLPTA